MKTSFAWAACLSMVLLLGCQQSSPPASRSSPAAPPQGNASAPSAQEKEAGAATEPQADADQPDDPGMTAAHDKTVKQEEPSGDESSRAGPNEGDAEPPQ